jgi:hypothetical protein
VPSFAVLYLLIFCRSTRQHFHFWCLQGNGFRPPNFLFAAPKRIACAAFSKESRMKFVDPTQPYRKFGTRLFIKKSRTSPKLTVQRRSENALGWCGPLAW